MKKIDPDKEIAEITRLAKESEEIAKKRQKRKELSEKKRQKKREEATPSMPPIISFLVILASIYGLTQIYNKMNTKEPTVQIASFQNENNCKVFTSKNPSFSNVDCTLAKKQAEKRNLTTSGGKLLLNGRDGSKCYTIDKISGFSVVVAEGKKHFHTLPLYYTRNIDINTSILNFPNGSPAKINKSVEMNPIEVAKLAKRSKRCF